MCNPTLHVKMQTSIYWISIMQTEECKRGKIPKAYTCTPDLSETEAFKSMLSQLLSLKLKFLENGPNNVYQFIE